MSKICRSAVLIALLALFTSLTASDSTLVQAVILAGGQSKRFLAPFSKLLAPLCGRPLITYVPAELKKLNIATTLVTSPGNQALRDVMQEHGLEHVTYAEQTVALGTGHALACSRALWRAQNILVLNGDSPLTSSDEIQALIDSHQKSGALMTIFASNVSNPFATGCGRIINRNGKILIVEQRDCTPEEAKVTLLNVGVYLINTDFLHAHIDKLTNNNAAKEYYITDLVQLASEAGGPVNLFEIPFERIRSVNTLEELNIVEHIKRQDIVSRWRKQGVRFEDPQSTYIDDDVTIGKWSYIGAGAHLFGGSTIGEQCEIGPFAVLSNVYLHSKTHVLPHAFLSDCEVTPTT